MAITIPQSIPKKATSGEKLAFKHFSSLSDNYFVHYETIIGEKESRPDFILIDLNYGIHVVEVKDWSTDKIKLVEYLEEDGEWIFQVESIRGNKIERRSNPEDQVLKYRNDILKSLKSYKDLRINENQLKFTVNPIIAFPNINSYEFKDQGFEK